MLAATTTEFDSLGMMKLALRLRRSASAVPDTVRGRFEEILLNAKRACNDLSSVGVNASAEAFEFAVELLARRQIRELLESIETLDQVEPQRAADVLEELEKSPVLAQ